MRLLAWCTDAALRAPARVLALAVGVLLALAPGLFRLELRTDGRALVPERDPAVVADAAIRARFNLRETIVVLLESKRPEGIFHLDFLRQVLALTQALQALPEVGAQHVVSLATEPSTRFGEGAFTLLRLLDPLPDTDVRMQRLRRDLDTIGILDGTLVGHDRRAATVLVGIPDAKDRTATVAKVRAVAERYADATLAVHVVGAPVAQALLGRHILADLALLVPLSMAAVALVVLAFCRRVAAVALALVKIGGVLLFVAGLMGMTGAPIYLTTAILPVLLVTLALADEIHLLAHYQHTLSTKAAAGAPAVPAAPSIASAIADLRRALVLTSLTTALGFASFLGSDLPAIRSLGIFAPAGILFSLLWTLTVTPALTTWFGARALAAPAETLSARTARWHGFARGVARHARVVGALLLAVSAVAAWGASRVVVQDSWIEGFAPGSPFRTSAEFVQSNLFGTHTLLLAVAADQPQGAAVPRGLLHAGPLLDPARLLAIRQLEDVARAQPGVGGVLGLHTQMLALLSVTGHPRTLTPHTDEIERLVRLFDTARGEHRRREMIADDMQHTVVMCLLQNANYQDTERIMAALQAHAAQSLTPLGMRLEFGGDIAVSQAMIPAIIRTQLWSLLLAIVLSIGVLWVAFRSLTAACLCLLPSVFGALWVLGCMGFFGIPLGVATSMFCAISIGVGVDYAIHLHERVSAARSAAAQCPSITGLATSTPANVADAVAIAMGFSLLLLSQVPANARLGALVALALAAACVLTVIGLGAVYARGASKPLRV